MAKKQEDVKPWERQNKETPKQFEAFVAYRDMGMDRSLSKVAKVLGKSAQLMSRWSSDNKWVERCAAWDNEQDRIARQEQIKEIKKMRKRHADTANLMINISNMGLAAMIDRSDPSKLKLKKDVELKPNDIARLVEVASKLERISRGDTSEVVEQRQGEAVDAVQIYIPSNGRERENANFDDLEV